MKISISSNLPQIQAALAKGASQVPYATKVAINNTAAKAQTAVRKQMAAVFDRPTPWVLNSIRIKYATTQNLQADLAFKDKNTVESSRSMVEPNVFGGARHFKAMEARLMGIGLLPSGYNVVPGGAAKLDAYGNMSRGQITQLLNVLGTYTEAGYSKADARTVARLAKGNVKKNIYGFTYWVNKVGSPGRNKRLQPGVYQRVKTGFGTSLKPVLIFVKKANYKHRLDFFGVAEQVVSKEFPGEFERAFDEAMRTALLKNQGSLL